MVRESAFWTCGLLFFLEVPEDVRPALSTQRLIRLNELHHPAEDSARRRHMRGIAAAAAASENANENAVSLHEEGEEAAAATPLLISAPVRPVRSTQTSIDIKNIKNRKLMVFL